MLLAALAALSLTAGVLLSSRRPEVRKATVGALVVAAVFGVPATPVYALAGDPFPSPEYEESAGRRASSGPTGPARTASA
ncbi:hypothetical protein [Streptomyces sp. 147326]|uniref:hypothetical protein n=1 Tax=Streptomyces sp. 147326 TaxID=3074379 RepID=UPI0038576958